MANNDIGISDELKHHGIKGMRWGVRRTKKQLGHDVGKKSKKKKSSKVDEDDKPEAAKKPARKSAKDMTDAELNAAINRMQLEQRYNQLNPQQVSKGKAVATRVINNMVIPAAEDVGKQLIKSAMVKGVNKTFNLNDEANIELKVYTNNKKKN